MTIGATLLSLALSPLGPAISAAQVPPNADLATVSITANSRHAKVGQEVTFTSVAVNSGPDLTDGLYIDAARTFQSLEFGPTLCDRFGDCSGNIVCDRAREPIPSPDGSLCEFNEVRLGELVAATVAFRVQATGSKYASNTACALSADNPPRNDPNPANDCATATVKIVGKRR